MKKFGITFFISFILIVLQAQTYQDFIGAGQINGVSISSSDEASNAKASIDGNGLDLDIRAASRFLAHSTLGYTIEDIQAVTETSFETWIDQQMQVPASNYIEPTLEIILEWFTACQERLGENCRERFLTIPAMWRSAWWDNTMKGEDLLRQRVAMALSEIIVVSDQSNLRFFPQGLATFYDILASNAFGNYEDILNEISLNYSMGFYLSHLNNPKTDTVKNIRPDENFAREIMQLFTIGLYELNNNGTRKLDEAGLWIPTYDNDDIKGLAKVFTGLSGGAWARPNMTEPLEFGRDYREYLFTEPMIMYEEHHEPGDKVIVGGHVIPAGQTGMEDIREAISVLFNHDNVGPFLATRLIQRLVKSNPSDAYVGRVASAFNDNGEGVRGDLGAMVKAILLDEEALACYWIDDPVNGMLRQPMLRYTQLLKGLKAETESERFYNWGNLFLQSTDQHVLSSPTVFNFYSPDYVPNADFAYQNMVAPEFQIFNSSTSSNYVNFMLYATMRDYLNTNFDLSLPNYLNGPLYNPYDRNRAQYEARLADPLFLELVNSPEELIDYLDILLTNGALSEDTKTRILQSMSRSDLFTPKEAAHYALFQILIDPDFVIMR